MTPLLQYAANRLRPTARAVAEFLGPDGIVDVAAGLAWPKAAAAWAPGLALYPVEAETGLLADKPDYLARNLEEAARRQQVQRMNEQAAAFRKLAGERTQAFNASQGQRLRGLVDQYNGAELPLLEALSGQDLRSPVIQRRAGGGAIKRMARYLNPEFLPPRLSPLEAVKEKGGNWAGVGEMTLPKRLYRGIRYPALSPGPLEQLAGARMIEPASNKMINTTKGATWWTSNPRASSSYTYNHGGARSLVVPADMVMPPDVVMSADGAPWNRYFSNNRAFKKAMLDPAVRAIMVKDVVDVGNQWFDQLPELVRATQGKKSLSEIMDEYFMADNVLVKDHSVLRYLSGEPVEYAHGGRL